MRDLESLGVQVWTSARVTNVTAQGVTIGNEQVAASTVLWAAGVRAADIGRTLGVPVDQVFNTLSATLGTYYVNDFNKYGRTWQVLMSADPQYRKRPEDIGELYVRSDTGSGCRVLVPFRRGETVAPSDASRCTSSSRRPATSPRRIAQQ